MLVGCSRVNTDIGQIFYGDSIESLQRFEGAIDLFINDSDHSAESMSNVNMPAFSLSSLPGQFFLATMLM